VLRDHKKTGLIVALDVLSSEEAIKVAKQVRGHVDAIKIGLPLILYTSAKIIGAIKDATNLPIIADLKLSDVCDFTGISARALIQFGADGVTVHGFVGPESVKACIKAVGPHKDVIVMTEITHPDSAMFMDQVSIGIATMARSLGASSIQVPGNKPEKIKRLRQVVGSQMTIFCCGMGVQGGEFGHAIAEGADFEMVGRSIYKSACPEESAKMISGKTKQAMFITD
jgi:orotidine-5'-phosphate decarboxylase